jgi:hypothetical protein
VARPFDAISIAAPEERRGEAEENNESYLSNDGHCLVINILSLRMGCQ